jgi:Resolvase, N terminal domain
MHCGTAPSRWVGRSNVSTYLRIHVLDCDLGKSGSQSAGREGFQKLVGEVALGKAGLVMGLEVSRLARNSADWHRLIELCSLAGTLILDEDGIYDPANFNDRLLLGLNRPDSYHTSCSTSRGSVNLFEICLGHQPPVARPLRPQRYQHVNERPQAVRQPRRMAFLVNESFRHPP